MSESDPDLVDVMKWLAGWLPNNEIKKNGA